MSASPERIWLKARADARAARNIPATITASYTDTQTLQSTIKRYTENISTAQKVTDTSLSYAT